MHGFKGDGENFAFREDLANLREGRIAAPQYCPLKEGFGGSERLNGLSSKIRSKQNDGKARRFAFNPARG
jgi:hypothetical protein